MLFKSQGVKAVFTVGILAILGIITLGAVSLSVIVGDWLYTETHAYWLAWTLGAFTLVGFIGSAGVVLGTFFALRHKSDPHKEYTIVDTMETLIQQMRADDSSD